jgi:hypothetical protein
MHLTRTPQCSRTLFLSRVLCPLRSLFQLLLKLLLLRWRAARLVAQKDVDVDVVLVLVVGVPASATTGNSLSGLGG